MGFDHILLNETGFIREKPVVAIPYLTLLCVFTLSGCIGNMMVIGAVLTHKVSFTDRMWSMGEGYVFTGICHSVYNCRGTYLVRCGVACLVRGRGLFRGGRGCLVRLGEKASSKVGMSGQRRVSGQRLVSHFSPSFRGGEWSPIFHHLSEWGIPFFTICWGSPIFSKIGDSPSNTEIWSMRGRHASLFFQLLAEDLLFKGSSIFFVLL